MEQIIQILDGGGVLALAILVWYELRLFRKSAVPALQNLSIKQELILEKQREIHICPNSKYGAIRGNGAISL